MQKRLDAQVLASIAGYRKREKALAKIEELSRKDAWAVAMQIRLMASRQAKLWHRLCYERFGFDVQRWLAKDPADFSSLTRSRSSGDSTTIVEHVLAYAHWEWVRILTAATEKAAIEQRADRDRVICDVYVGWLRFHSNSSDWQQYYSKLPPALGEQLLVDEAGWAGSQLNLNVNKRLHVALTGWGGSTPENLARELPGAILDAYGTLAEGAQHSGSFLTQVARALENIGGESAIGPGKLTSLPPENARNGSKDEDMAKFEKVEMLDSLEQAAGLSPQQTAVWRRLRQGMEIMEIAAELGVSENSVSVQKNNAIKKLREASTTAEF